MSYVTNLKREVVIKKKRCKDRVYPKGMYVSCHFLLEGKIRDLYDHLFVFRWGTRKIVQEKALFAVRYAHAHYILEGFEKFNYFSNKSPLQRDCLNNKDFYGCPSWEIILL